MPHCAAFLDRLALSVRSRSLQGKLTSIRMVFSVVVVCSAPAAGSSLMRRIALEFRRTFFCPCGSCLSSVERQHLQPVSGEVRHATDGNAPEVPVPYERARQLYGPWSCEGRETCEEEAVDLARHLQRATRAVAAAEVSLAFAVHGVTF